MRELSFRIGAIPLGAVLALAFCSVVRAIAAAEPVVEIDKIVVTAGRDASRPSSGSGFVQKAEVRDASPASSAADVSGRLAGVHILRYGGLEAATSISLRGSSREQVNLFLDDVPLDTASGEGVGLQHVSAAGLSRIEVFKSFSPVADGADAMGGSVHLRSRPVAKGWRQKYSLSGGSFFTAAGRAETSHGGIRNDFGLALDFNRTDGDFTYHDDNGTPLNPADDATVRRANNASRLIHPSVRWSHRIDADHSLALASHLFRVDAGVPGLQNFQSDTASKSLTEWLGQFTFRKRSFWRNRLSLKNLAYWRLIKSQFSDPNGEIGLGAGQDNDNLTALFGDRLTASLRLSKRFRATAAAEYVSESFTPKDYLAADPTGATSVRRQIVLGVEPESDWFDGKLRLGAQIRQIHAFYEINDDDPSLAARATFFSDRAEHPVAASVRAATGPFYGVTFKVSAGRAVRLPRFAEMFGDQGYVLGNPRLKSEKSRKFDVGASWARELGGIFGMLRAEAAYFESHADDLIQFELANGLARADNLGKARVRGVEAGVNVAFLENFELSEAYTWQKAEDRSLRPGNALVGRAEHESNTALLFAKGPVRAEARLNFLDNQYLDALNVQRIDNRLRLDLEAAYRFKKPGITAAVEAKNLTGSQIVDAVGFPLPGRSFFGRVEAGF